MHLQWTTVKANVMNVQSVLHEPASSKVACDEACHTTSNRR